MNNFNFTVPERQLLSHYFQQANHASQKHYRQLFHKADYDWTLHEFVETIAYLLKDYQIPYTPALIVKIAHQVRDFCTTEQVSWLDMAISNSVDELSEQLN